MNVIASVALSGIDLGAANPAFAGSSLLNSNAGDGISVVAHPLKQAAKLPQPDHVDLSRAAEARLMRSQGDSLAEIEAIMGVGAATVTSYLGIADETQASSAVAPASKA